MWAVAYQIFYPAWATVSLGALDDSIVSVATSPTGLTKYGGSVG